jgi:hypothetical protein
MSANKGFFYVPEAPQWVTSTRPTRCPKAGAGLPRRDAVRQWRRHQRALPEVPAPRLSRARTADLAVVRVPVPRQPVQPGR